jgi:hypothetical protein
VLHEEVEVVAQGACDKEPEARWWV